MIKKGRPGESGEHGQAYQDPTTREDAVAAAALGADVRRGEFDGGPVVEDLIDAESAAGQLVADLLGRVAIGQVQGGGLQCGTADLRGGWAIDFHVGDCWLATTSPRNGGAQAAAGQKA